MTRYEIALKKEPLKVIIDEVIEPIPASPDKIKVEQATKNEGWICSRHESNYIILQVSANLNETPSISYFFRTWLESKGHTQQGTIELYERFGFDKIRWDWATSMASGVLNQVEFEGLNYSDYFYRLDTENPNIIWHVVEINYSLCRNEII